ncbi:MAG: hypothetical protein SCALA702_24000 [Melioribacteraceae bacterium]|nr:MAG: hypothetical protein SCALA702_24000 [Melioribacteraceae bacterium]
MKRIFLFWLLAITFISAQNFQKVKIYSQSDQDFRNIQQILSDLDHLEFQKDGAFITFLDTDEVSKLADAGVRYDVLIADWKEYYNSLPRLTEEEKESYRQHSKENFGVEGFGYGSMGGFYTFAEILEKLDEMRINFPELITEKFSIGTSIEGRDIWAVKISDNPSVDEGEPRVFFDALIHAREPASMSTQFYFMFYLLENYGTDPEVTYLVDNREIYCVPCVNPDGYEYNRQNSPNGGGMWRKNRKNSGGGNYGVDLNRNFGYAWGWDNSGSSPYAGDETYRGPSAFSEPESQVIRDFTIGKNIKTYINMHTYSNVIIYPWGYQNAETPDSLTYRGFASDMSQFNGYDYGYSGAMLGYNSNGTVRDWMYGEQEVKNKIFGYVFEIGSSSDGFWPSQSRIYPLAQENLGALMYNAWVAGEYVATSQYSTTPEYFAGGDDVTLNLTMKNKGLSTAFDVQLELESLSFYINVSNPILNVDSVSALSDYEIPGGFLLQVDSTAPTGVPQQLAVTASVNGTVMSIDTITVIPGVPTFLVDDSGTNISQYWTVTASPSTPKWEPTTSAYFSAPSSYTDSKTGEYQNNCEIIMKLTSPVDLTGIASPRLTFRTKWAIEDSWDCGRVEISTNNGSTWTALEGEYTNPGSGQGQQTSGVPLYDGTMNEWVLEDIDLADFTDEQIIIRFILESDGYITRDGWYLDDIGIYYYGGGSSNPSCVNITLLDDWNLLSVPFEATNMGTDDLFPGAVSPAYGFNDGYVVLDPLPASTGFWIKFDQSGVVQICGEPLGNTIPVSEGWNLVGGTHLPTNVSTISSNPAGIIETQFFGYNGTYTLAEQLSPGQGYWIKVTQDGELLLSGGAAKTKNINYTNSILLTDASGKVAELKLSDSELNAEMPPLPPHGAFDVRFDNNQFAVSSSSVAGIDISGAAYPLEISALTGEVSLTIDGKNVVFSNKNPLVLTDAPGSIVMSGSLQVTNFELAQNYPNPFNPSTKIKFALPVESKVSVTIYNMLGQKVKELVSGQFDTGIHEVEFSASELASGMYIYSISALGADGNNFSSSKKMILMK